MEAPMKSVWTSGAGQELLKGTCIRALSSAFPLVPSLRDTDPHAHLCLLMVSLPFKQLEEEVPALPTCAEALFSTPTPTPTSGEESTYFQRNGRDGWELRIGKQEPGESHQLPLPRGIGRESKLA